jgi:hypothetical protein
MQPERLLYYCNLKHICNKKYGSPSRLHILFGITQGDALVITQIFKDVSPREEARGFERT